MSITLELSPDLVEKKDRLLRVIQNYGKVLVAFSGGVDSTFLLAAARKALSRHDVLAVTAVSPSFAKGERERCGELVTFLDVEWKIVETEEFKNPQYLANSSNRCYFCKSNLYSKMTPLSKNGGYQRIINGLNLDDLSDIRPGQQAAIEADVESPLRDTGFGKMEIREISRAWSLPTWNRPETPCLSSGVRFGAPVYPALLRKIDEAERSIRKLGFQVIRVRTDGMNARIEIGKDELDEALRDNTKETICQVVKLAGFNHVTIDPEGYRRGSL